MSQYRWGSTSLQRMMGVRPELIICATYVLDHIDVCDVTIPHAGGLRTEDQQQAFLDAGTSRKKDSAHLYGLALDIVPYIDGPRWDIEHALVQEGYDEIWRLWGEAASRHKFRFRRRISWDWPHHELVA